jgi:integrase
MTRPGWARTHVNRQIARLKHVFKWSASMELVPASMYQGLATVPGLKKGRTDAREREPVKPVPLEHVDAIKSHVSRQIWAMVELQLLTGMRPSEVCMMRAIDIATSKDIWAYDPTSILITPRCRFTEMTRCFSFSKMSRGLGNPLSARSGVVWSSE